jgi:hypothetical protein
MHVVLLISSQLELPTTSSAWHAWHCTRRLLPATDTACLSPHPHPHLNRISPISHSHLCTLPATAPHRCSLPSNPTDCWRLCVMPLLHATRPQRNTHQQTRRLVHICPCWTPESKNTRNHLTMTNSPPRIYPTSAAPRRVARSRSSAQELASRSARPIMQYLLCSSYCKLHAVLGCALPTHLLCSTY